MYIISVMIFTFSIGNFGHPKFLKSQFGHPVRPKKINCLFPVTVWKKKSVGRSVKKFFLHYFFGQKSVFYACFTLIGSWMGDKNIRVGIFLNKNLLG